MVSVCVCMRASVCACVCMHSYIKHHQEHKDLGNSPSQKDTFNK